MPDNQELTSKELDDPKGEDLNDNLLPCRKCGMLDYDFWDGKGTQAYLTCNECGQEEGIQVTDLYDNVNDWPKFCQKTISYPLPAIDKTNKALIAEWNTRAPSKQLTTTQQALDSAVKALNAIADNEIGKFHPGDYAYFMNRGIKLAKAALASIKE